MKLALLLPLAIAASALPCGAALASGETSATIYAEAVAAVKKNNCLRALPLLEQYRDMEKAKLDRNPKFRAQLERQIRECRVQNILVMSGQIKG